jgi:hypothetical protein
MFFYEFESVFEKGLLHTYSSKIQTFLGDFPPTKFLFFKNSGKTTFSFERDVFFRN